MRISVQIARVLTGFAFLFLLVVIQAKGQDEPSHKALKLFEKAQSHYRAGEWKDCEKELNNAIREDSTVALFYIMLGDVLLETARPAEAVDQYRKALEFDHEQGEIVCNLLANTLFSLERYAEAATYYEKVLTYPDIKTDLRSSIELKLKTSAYRQALVDNPVSFDPVDLGPSVNTSADEYINALSADGSGIYFTRRTKSEAGDERDFNEDFYYAEFTGDSLPEAKKLNYPPGKDNDAGALCISPDGRLLFFTSCFRNDGYGSCDLYISEKTGGTWSVAMNMGSDINSESWDAQPSVSPDGKILYFASNRNGGIGSSDIWKTERTADGGWGKPVNLGTPVNTPSAEMAPFLHFDNQSLYYSSKGHQGMGGADLFRTIRTNGKWTEPENLGYPINSSADELVIIVNPIGNKGFISRNNPDDIGKYDIFTFELHDAMRPIPVSYLKGKVYDAMTGLPLEASFELIDLALDSAILDASSDKLTGEFLVCLPGNRTYALNVSCKGYLFYSDHFPFSEIKSSMDPVLKDIPLEPIAVGKSTVLRNIFYETGQYQLKSISYSELDKLVDFLTSNPGLRVEIGGHTDDVGTEEDNLELSRNRAGAVYQYMLDHGLTTGRITFRGYGESKPVSLNDSGEARALNRRTEITIIE